VGLIIFPAIDLRDGRVVRLRQGDPAAQTIFDDDPVAVARRWAGQGAGWLHVVNLDGALAVRRSDCPGEPNRLPVNLRRLADIRAATDVPLQFGGGLRTLEDVELALRLGATRIVLGTLAVQQPEIVEEAIVRFGAERIMVGIDARDGRVAIHGWRETSALAATAVARHMRNLGVERVVYTDIARDGTLAGVNVAAAVDLARRTGLKVIASGGVASLNDIRALAGHAADGIEGVIIGQALYTAVMGLREAIAAGQEGTR
jgi:phosphoribosylformimino-5-aminoimidazole carboxamide ribotide isomerase